MCKAILSTPLCNESNGASLYGLTLSMDGLIWSLHYTRSLPCQRGDRVWKPRRVFSCQSLLSRWFSQVHNSAIADCSGQHSPGIALSLSLLAIGCFFLSLFLLFWESFAYISLLLEFSWKPLVYFNINLSSTFFSWSVHRYSAIMLGSNTYKYKIKIFLRKAMDVQLAQQHKPDPVDFEYTTRDAIIYALGGTLLSDIVDHLRHLITF